MNKFKLVNNNLNIQENKMMFGDVGITSTSANNIANLAKEYYLAVLGKFEFLSFYNTELSLLTHDADNQGSLITVATSRDKFDSIEKDISKVYKARALCSYLREALYEKQKLIKKIDEWELQSFAEYSNIEYPKQPPLPIGILSTDLERELPLEKRVRYFNLQSVVSTLGDLIHNGGPIITARNQYKRALVNPTLLEGRGQESTISRRTPSSEYTEEEIENLFFSLQQTHRSHQKELNSIKYEIEENVRRINIENEEKYQVKLEEYHNNLKLLRSKFNTHKDKERNRLSNLKIVIPDELKDIYDFISSLGK